MIEKFIDSVLIIDDDENEINDLKKLLEKKDIWVTYFSPPKDKIEIDRISKPFKNRKLIFLDLRIDDTKKTIDNISVIIRPLFQKVISKDFGTYGIVMWTKHEKHIKEFKEKILKDKNKYDLPLFIIGLDKLKYIKNGYENIFRDLEEEIKKSIAANFFINWSNLVKKGRDKAITSIFELIDDYEKQDKKLEFLLFKMAQNHTGIPDDQIKDYPLSIDAFKAFNDILAYEINSMSGDIGIFKDINNLSYTDKKGKVFKVDTKIKKIGKELLNIFAEINSRLLIDEVNIQQDVIIPGNVYEVKDKENKLSFSKLPDKAIPIVIEMTPPCDFSNKKSIFPRVMSGYIIDYNYSNRPDSENYYKHLWPIKLSGFRNPQMVFFDFRLLGFVDEDDLKNEEKFVLIFRVKDKLFADILQKMSAHIARLGLGIIQ